MVNAISTFPSFIGSKKETTYGTPVVVTAFTPATAIATDDVRNYVPDTAMRGSAVDSYNEIPTQGWGTFTYDSPVYMDVAGIALKGLLGAEDMSGTGPYTHVFAVNNASDFQPPSYTIVDYNGYEARRFAGAVFSQVAYTLDATGLLVSSQQGTALASASTTKPSQSFSALKATAGYTGVISVGGTPTTLVRSGTVTLARQVTPIVSVNNSTSPTQIWGGAVSCTGSLSIIYTDDTFLTPMLNGTEQAIDITYTDPDSNSLELHMTAALFTAAPITRDNDGTMTITVAFTAVANTTDGNTAGTGYSPIKATLINAQSTAY